MAERGDIQEGPLTSLTAPQRSYLGEIVEAGPKGHRYNSRAEKLLKYLRDAGLVTLDVQVGSSDPPALLWTAVATDAGRNRLQVRRVRIRRYGSLPSCRYWSAYDADDDTQQPLLPSYAGRRKHDVVQIVTNNGWEVVR